LGDIHAPATYLCELRRQLLRKLDSLSLDLEAAEIDDISANITTCT
jgi:hypothetical protein